MKKTSSHSTRYIDRIRSWARTHAHGRSKRSDDPTLPLTSSHLHHRNQNEKDGATSNPNDGSAVVGNYTQPNNSNSASNNDDANKSAGTASEAEGTRPVIGPSEEEEKKANIILRFFTTAKKVLLHSWINVLLIFVPVGIAVANVPGMQPGVIFAMNAIAIIPLAGLLSHATESVARKLGDTVGALLNVTFGNAVELIIFIIALVKNEIRIVQSSLLGSILANLLLILGMSFFLGGLRFREQIYNSTVTQMSACLLSLSVISLVLPTAFHASFQDTQLADQQSLKISRGTSVILLLVYVVYLLFQLKSHAYMYESTPQHIIDEESTPGPAAAWLDTSSSDSSSSSDSDTDGSSHSENTVSKRVKRAIRSRRRRKSSLISAETHEGRNTRSSSFGTNDGSPFAEGSKSGESAGGHGFFPRTHPDVNEDVIEEEAPRSHKRRHKHKRRHRKHRKTSLPIDTENKTTIVKGDGVVSPVPPTNKAVNVDGGEPRRVDFAENLTNMDRNADSSPATNKRPFTNLRGVSFRKPVARLAPTVFVQSPTADLLSPMPVPSGPVPRVRYGIRRTNSLPGRLNQYQFRPPGAMLPSQIPHTALRSDDEDMIHDDDLSRTAAVVMLLISTALVALCAEFMVDTIQEVVETGPLGEIFIGLILLPIIGNAAEHVTAITVAMKNKMDLAIGVAVGSSIQIALFITPLVVILGWIIDRNMTLYFTLFETVCLFVSTFIVNFLVLDGRSNYLEGALLCSTYVIIGVVAYFYPEQEDASAWGA